MPTESNPLSTPRTLLQQLKLPALALVVGVSTMCTGLDNIDVATRGVTTVPGSVVGSLLGQFSFAGFNGIDVSESQDFRNQGYTKDQIDSARLKVFTLDIDEPATANFNFLSKLSFFAESEGLPRVEIARLEVVPRGVRSLEMEILDVELVDYAAAESMTITTTATGTSPEEDTTIIANVVLDIDVNVDGALGCQVSSL